MAFVGTAARCAGATNLHNLLRAATRHKDTTIGIGVRSPSGLPGQSKMSLVGAVNAAPSVFVSSRLGSTGRPWLGFGFNQYPLCRDGLGHDTRWTEDTWRLTTGRMAVIQPALVRINLYRGWFNPQVEGSQSRVGPYAWNDWRMQEFYKVVRWYRERKIPVMSGLWDYNYGVKDFYTSKGEDSFQSLQVDLLEHLFKVEHLTNIRWYTPTNEPKGGGVSFEQWSTMIRNTHEGFSKAGLPKDILVGPDSWDDWTAQSAEHDRDYLRGYDHHYYLNNGQSELTDGSLEATLRTSQVDAVYGKDPDVTKPVFLGEMGAVASDHADYWFTDPHTSPIAPDFEYGLGMLDYGIQAARAGEASALAWALDGFDNNKSPGMWDISGQHGGLALRPWYYTWSLLCRYFPAGAAIHKMGQQSNMRIVAAEVAAGKGAHWSLALVNRDPSQAHTVRLQVPGWGAGKFDAYTYCSASQGDGTALVLPSVVIKTASGGLESGLDVTVPAGGGMVLTTMNRMPLTVVRH